MAKYFDESIANSIIKHITSHFDLEELHFKIKNGKNIQDVSDNVANLIDELIQHNDNNNEVMTENNKDTIDIIYDDKDDNTNRTETVSLIPKTTNSEGNESKNDEGANIAVVDDDFVKKIYDAIAECFMLKESSNDGRSNLLISNTINNTDEASQLNNLDKECDWVCYNCANHNFSQYIGGKMHTNLSLCKLCGVSQKDSVIIALRNYDSYTMVSNTDKGEGDEKEENMAKDKVDLLLQEILDCNSFELCCSNRMDKQACPSILRLAKRLINYKKWINIVYSNMDKANPKNVNKTVEINVKEYIDADKFKEIFVGVAMTIKQITKNKDNIQKIETMLNNNNVMNLDILLTSPRKEFINIMKEQIGIKTSVSAKLYKMVINQVKEKSQTLQFGKFLTDLELNIDTIDRD
eukprot:39855_1